MPLDFAKSTFPKGTLGAFPIPPADAGSRAREPTLPLSLLCRTRGGGWLTGALEAKPLYVGWGTRYRPRHDTTLSVAA
jgi:hypothetical protein